MYHRPFDRISSVVFFQLMCSLILTSSLLISSVSARTWYIKPDGTGDAPTIQAGVDSAATGDTVLVAPGTYSDTTHVMVAGTIRAVNVHIQRQITLLGESSAERSFIDGVHSYVGIFVESVTSTVSIGHLRLKGTAFLTPPNVDKYLSDSEAEREYPARIRCHAASVEVQDVVISHDHDGVFLSNSTAEIRDSELHTLAMAILSYDASNASVCNNYIYNGPVGVECDHSSAYVANNAFGAPPPAGQTVSIYCRYSSVEVRENTMSWSDGGLSAIQSQVIVDGNIFSNPYGSGVSLGNSSAVITNNIFFDCNWGAVYSQSGTTGEISNNTIDGCDVGIVAELGTNQLIRNNIISRGFWGIQCQGSSLTVECNNIFDMSSGIYDWLCVGQPGEGNFSADPEYCGIDDSGNYFLQSDSPCAPGNHPDGRDCGLIGAQPVNCGKVEVKRSTWGSIKNRFNDGGDR